MLCMGMSVAERSDIVSVEVKGKEQPEIIDTSVMIIRSSVVMRISAGVLGLLNLDFLFRCVKFRA